MFFTIAHFQIKHLLSGKTAKFIKSKANSALLTTRINQQLNLHVIIAWLKVAWDDIWLVCIM